MFGNLDPVRVLVVVLAAVVLLGPDRLPRAARQAGKLWRDLTTLRERLENEVRNAIPDLGLPAIPDLPRIPGLTTKGSVGGYIADLMSTSSTPAAAGSVATGSVAAGSVAIGEATAEGSAELAGAGASAGTTATAGLAGTAGATAAGLTTLSATPRPGSRPGSRSEPTGWATAGRSALQRSAWRTSATDGSAELPDVPAGWHAQAAFPGYASGAHLANVPTSMARGPISVEANLTFDEPSWN